MTGPEPPRWRVVVTAQANADLRAILDRTSRTFGTEQRRRYRDAVRGTLAMLREGPAPAGSRRVDPAQPELRRLGIRGARSPHLLIFREVPVRTVLVLRVLHGAMDLPRHLPEPDG